MKRYRVLKISLGILLVGIFSFGHAIAQDNTQQISARVEIRSSLVQNSHHRELDALKMHCAGKKINLIQSITLVHSQLNLVEYNRSTQLLYFNTYKELPLDAALKLRLRPTGLVFEMSPKDAQRIIRLYSVGAYRMRLKILLKPATTLDKGGCEMEGHVNKLSVTLLEASLVNLKNEHIAKIITPKGRSLSAKSKHVDKIYFGKGNPIVHINLTSKIVPAKIRDRILKELRKTLAICYRDALRKNGRFQSMMIFRFGKKMSIVDSGRNLVFRSCITKQIQKYESVVDGEKLSIQTIFRFE